MSAEFRPDNSLVAILRETVIGLVRLGGTDLSARQFTVLLICFLEDGPHTVRGLAGRLGISKAAICRLLDRLEEIDLLRRVPDPSDRRSVQIARTAHGAAYVSHVRSLMRAAAKIHSFDLDKEGRAALA